MFKGKKILSVLLVAVMISSLLFVFDLSSPQKVLAVGDPITMAGFGHRQVPGNTYGDTWETTWLANDKVYVQHNDGNGFGSGSYVHDRICELTGTPETPSSISGTNLNPGTLGNLFGGTYSTGTYEVDGALYHNICYSQQVPGAWVFRRTCIMKSTDGGATWLNHKGQTNVVPPESATDCTFPNDSKSQMCFVKYGQGGSAPNIDNAQNYVYLFSPNACPGDDYYLCRISRTALSNWTSTFSNTNVQYYKGGDGMQDANWTTDSTQAVSIYNAPGQCLQAGMMYDYGLQRYILIPANSDSWANPEVESTIYLLEAPHPWGPFTKVVEENVQNKENDNITWTYPMQKFASADGKKVWMTASGRAPYGLQFMPIYMTTNAVSTYQAESASLTGVNTATTKSGYTGTGYVTDFNAVGDKCQFTVNVGSTGAYIMKIRYNTSAHQTISCYVNGNKIETLELGKSEQVYTTWTDMTIFAWLTSGNNTVAIQYDSGNTGNLNLDKLSLALYSTVEGSLPNCPPPTSGKVNDTDSGITYSGSWSYSSTSTGYYNNDCHYSNTSGNYAQYTFNGTDIKWIGAKNTDHGKVDIYIDNVLDTSALSTYASSWIKQQVLYQKTGLSSGSHTIKIVLRSDKDAASSNYYQDVDAFEYGSSSATPTPTSTPAPTSTPTPTPAATATPTPTPGGHTDEFSSGTLGSGWSWIREDAANWSLTANSGHMRIVSQAQEIWQTTNTTENILLRNAPAGDWTMTAKLDTAPTSGTWTQGGIIAYKDDDNYVKCVRAYNGSSHVVQGCKEINAVGTGQSPSYSGTITYLKITKSGTTYTTYYSSDGSTWNQIVQYTGVDLGTSIRVGLIAQDVAGYNADFDWFDVR